MDKAVGGLAAEQKRAFGVHGEGPVQSESRVSARAGYLSSSTPAQFTRMWAFWLKVCSAWSKRARTAVGSAMSPRRVVARGEGWKELV